MTGSSGDPEPIWIFPKTDPTRSSQLERQFYLHPVAAQILVARGISTNEAVHRFLYPQLHDLLDPFLFEDMPFAVARITRAIEKQEPILIFGDTDVDGMTGTALLVSFLRALGGIVEFHLPPRTKPGDAVLPDALTLAQASGFRLLITVDCGITVRQDEVRRLREGGVDLIITDHHEPTSRVQECCAILNPKTAGSRYPNRDLTGVGVAFKLAQALAAHWQQVGRLEQDRDTLREYLDLVALGTVADLGALTGENRILVRYGLKELQHTKRAGLRALLAQALPPSIEQDSIEIVSRLAPRLNSLGRIADPRKGVEILMTEDLERAEGGALELEHNNLARQRIERAMTADLERTLKEHPELLQQGAIALSSRKWHPGVIPILSARLAKQYHRPVCLIAIEDGVGKGSLRTIPDFPLLPALHALRELLITYGGHDSAAGLVVAEEQVPQLLLRFQEIVQRDLPVEAKAVKLRLDAHVRLTDLTFELMESLALFEPFGNGNPPPVLVCHARLAGCRVSGKQHLKVYLEDDDRCLEGVALGMAGRRHELMRKGERLRVAFTPTVVTQMARAAIHLQIRDFRVLPDEPPSLTSEIQEPSTGGRSSRLRRP